MTPPIHTLTGNLLWEKTFTFAAWEAGRTQRARSASFQVGGKGINVAQDARAARRPRHRPLFPGGATGAECEPWVRAQGIPCQTFPVARAHAAGAGRAGARPARKRRSSDRMCRSKAAAARACADHLDPCAAGDVLAICGSVPGWGSDGVRAAARGSGPLDRRGARLSADTYGAPLAWLIERPLAWVKVNRTEFDALFARD